MLGEVRELSEARQGLQVYPTHTPSFLISMVALVRLDRKEEARAVAQQFLSVFPTYRIVPNWPVLGHFCDELRVAGIPGRRPEMRHLAPPANRSGSAWGASRLPASWAVLATA